MWGNIILHKCTINGNYMMCGSWDMKCNRHNFFVILGHFCPFTQNIKILKKWKKHLMVLSFYTSVPKTMIIVYTACYTILCYTMLYCFLSFYLPNSPKNQNFKKMKNMLGDIIILCMCAKNMIRWCIFPEIWCTVVEWTDRRTNGQKKWYIEVGTPPKKWQGPTFKL